MIGEVRDEAAGVLSRLGGDRVLEGEGECVFQVGQFGGAEFAGIVDQHDGPLAEQVVAPVNVLNNPVDRTVAVLATLGLPDVNLRLLVRGVAKHHVDTGLAHVLVHTEVTDLPSGDDVESVGHVRRGTRTSLAPAKEPSSIVTSMTSCDPPIAAYLSHISRATLHSRRSGDAGS